MKKQFSRIFAVLLVVSMLVTQLLVPVSAEHSEFDCTCESPVKGTKISTVAATCGYYGYTVYQCKTCKGQYPEIADAPTGNHNLETVPAQDPTCTEIGWAEYEVCVDCKYSTYVELDALGHDMQDVAGQDSTCSELGWEAYQACSRCDHIEGYVAIEKLPHTIKATTTDIKDATCEAPATQVNKEFCTVCGEVVSEATEETAPALGHNFVLVDSKPQICMVANGENVYACANDGCRETRKEVIEMAKEHDYELIYTDATCTEAGTEVHKCKACGFEYSKEIAAKGHTLVSIPKVDPTCTEPGSTAGKMCSVCGEITVAPKEIAPLGHDCEAAVTYAPTCNAEGYSVEHCKRCDKDIIVDGSIVAINPDNHVSASITKVAVKPTCTEYGSTEEIVCLDCGKVLKEVAPVDPLGHNYKKIHYNMTCEGGEYDVYTCTRCKDSYTDVIVPAPDHNPHPSVGYKAPTCTVEGYNFQVCLNEWCHEELKSNVVPALGHDWSASENLGDKHTHTCLVCGEVEEEAHVIVNHDAKAPTCTEIGWEAYETCEKCDYTTYVEIPALRHKMVIVDAKEATCTEDGHNEHMYCEVCDYTTYEKIDALGHRNENVPAKAPTCTEAGWTKHTECARCGETSPYVELAPLGHDIVIIEAIQPTRDTEGRTEGEYCARCGEVFKESVVIEMLKEDVYFTYETEGMYGSDVVVNSGKVTVNVYLNVDSDAGARLWGIDFSMLYDAANFELESVNGGLFASTVSNADAANGQVIISQDMGLGSAKDFAGGEAYLFATLTFKVNKNFVGEANFVVDTENCVAARAFNNELNLDFGTGAIVDVARLGDSDNNGKFNVLDTMACSIWFAQADEGEYNAIYDMDKDGDMDGDDFAILRGAIVGVEDYLDIVL